MACNKYKNKNYKSAVEFYNTVTQTLATTNTATNPLTLNLVSSTVTNTGVAIDLEPSAIDIECSGLYRVYADIEFTSTAAGIITMALTLDGVVLPETIKVRTVGTTGSIFVATETIRRVQTCCALEQHRFGVVVYSDGAATGTIDRVSGNAVKLA